jgi:hypothetical protein
LFCGDDVHGPFAEEGGDAGEAGGDGALTSVTPGLIWAPLGFGSGQWDACPHRSLKS